ncbi:MAG: acyltransferase family protein [Schwartzia sp.]|nr:acyltransferase family protein [Schwartzia sp. (in: firmicutes)]
MDCKRIIYLDYLRVLAMLAVMILHIACMGFHELDGSSLEWQILNFYDGIVRWGVHVFVMSSGKLFLSNDINKFHI